LLFRFLPLLLALVLASCGPRGDAWERVQESGVLRVGLDPTYPPFAVATESDLWGLDVDLARDVAAELGLEPAFTYFGYDGLYDALATNQVDVLVSALVIQPERTRDFAYTAPYFDAGQILVVPTGSTIEAPGDLAGRRLAVELGAPGHVLAIDLARNLPDLEVLTRDSAADALDTVIDGRADAAIADGIGGRLALAERPSLTWLPPPMDSEPYAIVVRADDGELLKNLDDALDALRTRGTLEKLTDRWLNDRP
jgi:ABC-type amino acid transport substrate-binding protein